MVSLLQVNTMQSAVLWGTLLSLASNCLGARILAVLPFPGKSHHIFTSAILNALAQRGHHIVEYSPFPPKKLLLNYSHVEVHSSTEEFFKKLTFEDIDKQMPKGSFYGGAALSIFDYSTSICEDTFKYENMKILLQSKDHFDMVITGSIFESLLVLGHKFNAPTVFLQPFSYSCTLNREAGNALSIASVPDSMSFLFTNPMTFVERLQNFVSVSLTLIFYYYSKLPSQDALVKKYYQYPNTPSVPEMLNKVTLTLINSHPAIDPQPYTPNIVPVGGIVVDTDRTALPQDIKEFMDSAEEGVIYFSLGTIIPVHQFPKEVLQIFINVFRKLPQKVLWKIETENLPGLSKSVKLVKWAPQFGVLDHPNCVVFITHGGLLSQQEAIYAGVPTVGIPFFFDQLHNVKFNEHHGIGVKVDLKTLSEETIFSAINSILSNKKYKENAHRLSQIFRDQPMSSADSAVFWIEYVLRHRGAQHLKSAATQLSWYQLALLDVLAVVVTAVVVVTVILYLVLRQVLFCVFKQFEMVKLATKKKVN